MNFIAQNFKEYQQLYKDSTENPEQFWNDFAQAEFTWKKPWDKVLGWDFKEAEVKWFEGAELNITENCLDRHLATIGDKTAIIWENNDPNEASINFTYKELHEQVCRFANTLLRLGITKGDRVCIYLPMVPELAIATLACARICWFFSPIAQRQNQ
jgi:acetyl-CoA synthetase